MLPAYYEIHSNAFGYYFIPNWTVQFSGIQHMVILYF